MQLLPTSASFTAHELYQVCRRTCGVLALFHLRGNLGELVEYVGSFAISPGLSGVASSRYVCYNSRQPINKE